MSETLPCIVCDKPLEPAYRGPEDGSIFQQTCRNRVKDGHCFRHRPRPTVDSAWERTRLVELAWQAAEGLDEYQMVEAAVDAVLAALARPWHELHDDITPVIEAGRTPVSSPTPDEQAAEGVTAEVTAFMCSDDEVERETFVHEVGDFAMNYSTDASPVGVVGTINKSAGEDSCPDCAQRMKPWQDREIWPLMNRAEPAMRDELLAAWAVRDEKIEAAAASEASLVVVREQLTQASERFGHDMAYMLVQFDRVLDVLREINMDTDEDRALHARVIETFELAAAPMRERWLNAPPSPPTYTTEEPS